MFYLPHELGENCRTAGVEYLALTILHRQPRLKIAAALLLALSTACSTTSVEPPREPPPEPPTYSQVPHPSGLGNGDLRAIFQQSNSPDPTVVQGCDSDFFKLRERTNSKDELNEGIKELVRSNPVKYHWCFYSKILELDAALKKDAYVDQRQKDVIHAYLFIAPVARAFLSQFSDSRYLRWAISRYRTLSEYVFFRKVEISPYLTSEMVGAADPYRFVNTAEEQDMSVMEKYGLGEPSTPSGVNRDIAAVPETATEALPLPLPDPSH